MIVSSEQLVITKTGRDGRNTQMVSVTTQIGCDGRDASCPNTVTVEKRREGSELHIQSLGWTLSHPALIGFNFREGMRHYCPQCSKENQS